MLFFISVVAEDFSAKVDIAKATTKDHKGEMLSEENIHAFVKKCYYGDPFLQNGYDDPFLQKNCYDNPFLQNCYDGPFLQKNCYDGPFLQKYYDSPFLQNC